MRSLESECEHCATPAPRAPSLIRPHDSASRLLVTLLLLVSLVIDAALLAMPGGAGELYSFALVGVALGQIVLVVAWAILGHGAWLLRLVAALGVIIVFAILLSFHLNPRWSEFLGFLLVYALLVAMPTVGWRLSGRGLNSEQDERHWRGHAVWRYSLTGLFAVTTAAAALAAVVRVSSLPEASLLIILGYEIGFTTVSLLALAPLLARDRSVLAVMLTLLALLTAPLIGSLVGAMETNPETIALLALCQSAYLTAGVWVLKAAASCRRVSL